MEDGESIKVSGERIAVTGGDIYGHEGRQIRCQGRHLRFARSGNCEFQSFCRNIDKAIIAENRQV